MIVEYLRYTIPEDQEVAFIRAYDAARGLLMRSAYAKAFEICQCVDDKTQFILRIEWTSADDHLTGFRKSPEFQEFFGHIRQFVSAITEMRHYKQLLHMDA
ncbi:MAG: antibiotic biosynthesis monooxygenase [Hyphomicrobiales bacterium]|nr:MAG: antibiotic biosynthesis monooxygenase [Hyphomicrobiales bacterium]